MRLEVVWGFASASIPELLEAASDEVDLVFVEPGGYPIVGRERRVMERIGRVVSTAAPVDADGIVAFSDAQLVETADRAARFGLRFHTSDTARLLTHKALQRAALAAAGLPQPTVHVAADAAELLSLLRTVDPPIVVKPVHGTGSRMVFGLTSQHEVAVFAAGHMLPGDAYPFLVESHIVGSGHPRHGWLEDFVSVETATFDGAHHHFAVTGRLPLRLPLRETGSVFPAMLPHQVTTNVASVTSVALDALGVENGISHTELKLTDGGPVVIEVNGRLGGAVAELQTLTGAYRPVRAAIDIALGRAPAACVPAEGYAAVLWHHLDGEAPADSVFDDIRHLDGFVRLHVPRDRSARVSEGRLAAPMTVVMIAATEDGLRAAVTGCRNLLRADRSRRSPDSAASLT